MCLLSFDSFDSFGTARSVQFFGKKHEIVPMISSKRLPDSMSNKLLFL